MAGPRRLEWDEPAPADLYEHLGGDAAEDDEEDEDAEQAQG